MVSKNIIGKIFAVGLLAFGMFSKDCSASCLTNLKRRFFGDCLTYQMNDLNRAVLNFEKCSQDKLRKQLSTLFFLGVDYRGGEDKVNRAQRRVSKCLVLCCKSIAEDPDQYILDRYIIDRNKVCSRIFLEKKTAQKIKSNFYECFQRHDPEKCRKKISEVVTDMDIKTEFGKVRTFSRVLNEEYEKYLVKNDTTKEDQDTELEK